MSAEIYLTIAFLFLFWVFLGLMQPRALFFARPEWQTRYNAFYFPLICAVFFALCFFSASGSGVPWAMTIVVAVFPVLYLLLLCGVGVRKNTPKPETRIRNE